MKIQYQKITVHTVNLMHHMRSHKVIKMKSKKNEWWKIKLINQSWNKFIGLWWSHGAKGSLHVLWPFDTEFSFLYCMLIVCKTYILFDWKKDISSSHYGKNYIFFEIRPVSIMIKSVYFLILEWAAFTKSKTLFVLILEVRRFHYVQNCI